MYTVELDISHETSQLEVSRFAKEHGCKATLQEEFGPAGGNPLYKFSSESFDMLRELIEHVFGEGHGFDEEEIKTMIVEV